MIGYFTYIVVCLDTSESDEYKANEFQPMWYSFQYMYSSAMSFDAVEYKMLHYTLLLYDIESYFIPLPSCIQRILIHTL